MRYAVAVPAGNASTANEPISALWNPDGNRRLRLRKVEVSGGTVMKIWLSRISTQGTRGTQTTPDADNAFNRAAAPGSGATLDRGDYTANPTEQGPPMMACHISGAAGNSVEWWFPQPIIIPPGTGIALWTNTTHTAMYSGYEWDE